MESDSSISNDSGQYNESVPQSQFIDDNDPSIVYHGQWQLSVNASSGGGGETLHSTNDPNASAFLSFYGSQISVVGNIPTGQDELAANYSVDGSLPHYRIEPALSQNTSLTNQMLFTSKILPVGRHNITINGFKFTGNKGRNYTITDFFISTMETPDKTTAKKNVGAIVGGVLGALIFLLLLSLGAFYYRRRRRTLILHAIPEESLDQSESVARLSAASGLEPSPFIIDPLAAGIYGYNTKESSHQPLVRRTSLMPIVGLSQYSNLSAQRGSLSDSASSISQTVVAGSPDANPNRGWMQDPSGHSILRKYHELASATRATRVQN